MLRLIGRDGSGLELNDYDNICKLAQELDETRDLVYSDMCTGQYIKEDEFKQVLTDVGLYNKEYGDCTYYRSRDTAAGSSSFTFYKDDEYSGERWFCTLGPYGGLTVIVNSDSPAAAAGYVTQFLIYNKKLYDISTFADSYCYIIWRDSVYIVEYDRHLDNRNVWKCSIINSDTQQREEVFSLEAKGCDRVKGSTLYLSALRTLIKQGILK